MADENQAPDTDSIPDSDKELLAQCRVETFMSGGKGGQHQNKTESGVRLVHLPTGITVTAREERSQHRNKLRALERLRERLEALARPTTPRIPTRVPGGEKKRRLNDKKKRSRLKDLRRKPPSDTGE